MNTSISLSVESFINEKITQSASVGGGCIADSRKIKTESGREFFLKTGDLSTQMFHCEANGLKELSKAQSLRVPKVIAVADDFLLLEYISQGIHPNDFFEKFGQGLARLHRFQGEHFGFFEDNYIGATPQLNIPDSDEAQDWTVFYFNKRLLFQYKLAERNGFASPRLKNSFMKLESSIDSILKGSEEPPCLLHGDLWGGNYLCDESGEAVLIDPAVYYGHREADLAMTKLFGGFSAVFYESYHCEYPLPAGWEYRENIYKLYHVLNHLNLFGTGYLREAEQLLSFYIA
jgi:fructosamine-3-kinase